MYPVVFLVPRAEKSSRLLMIFRPFLMLPVSLFMLPYGFAAMIVTGIAFWAIIIIGRYPSSMWAFAERYFRFLTQLDAYSYLLTDRYPPFNGRSDNGYPVKALAMYPDKMSRLMVFFRGLILFPHFFFSAGYGFVTGITMFLNFFAVLFTGRIPDSFWKIILGYFVYSSRLRSYMLLLVDEYPPFHGTQPLSAELLFQPPSTLSS
jgi:hypothetical protein